MAGCQEFRDEVDTAWLQISESDLEAQTPQHGALVHKAVIKPARGAGSLLLKLLRQWRGVGAYRAVEQPCSMFMMPGQVAVAGHSQL